MSQTIDAIYDGTFLRPVGDLGLPPNTRVTLTFDVVPPRKSRQSFLETARSLELDGSTDLADNLDKHLYGDTEPKE